MPNIQLNYLYRCGGNYKNYGEVIFSNPEYLTIEEVEAAIQAALQFEEPWFYPNQWGLPDLHFPKWDPELDHTFHEYEGVEYTHLPATDVRSIRQFIAAIL
jgi:hypothetical protein